MTTGQIIDAALKYYLNVGSQTVTSDILLRQRAEFILNNSSDDIWAAAPWWFRLGSATVSIASGASSGVCPTDFDGRFGYQGGVWLSPTNVGQSGPTYVQPSTISGYRNQALPQVSSWPEYYSLFGRDPDTFLPLLQVWPTAASAYTLNLTNYVKRPPTLVDKPTALTPAAGATAVLPDLFLTGVYSYQVTFVTADGETEGGVVSDNVTLADQECNLSAIPVSVINTVTGRNIYRTVAGGSAYKLLVSITDNVTTTYVDSVPDVSLGVAPPTPADAITGTDEFPTTFHGGLMYDYLVNQLAKAQGDLRESKWAKDWRDEIKRQWSDYKQGMQQTQVMPRYGVRNGNGSNPYSRPLPLGTI